MRIFLFILVFFLLISNKIFSLDLTITQGTIQPTPIAISNFYSKNNSDSLIGKNISMVISDNLERSGLFSSIDQKAFIQSSESLVLQPRFEDWKIIKAQHLDFG